MERRILVVDESRLAGRQLSRLLARPGRPVEAVRDGTAALEFLVEHPCSLVLTDLALPDFSGLELIREIRERRIPATIIVSASRPTVEAAVESMRLGAYEFVRKPIDADRLELLVDRALEDRRLADEAAERKRRLETGRAGRGFLGRSPRMLDVFERVTRVASSSCNVLITGETGTGKELVAQSIYDADVSRDGPLIAVNCAALPDRLLESEMFGHERGAFTGADFQKKGRFELARGGTLFLDEIGELPLNMQAKLLRVLQEGCFERVGGIESIRADCRIIAATNQNLSVAVAQGRFREDLFYRLNVVSIELPPLRERLEDVSSLVAHFLSRLEERRLPAKTFSRCALSRLVQYDWPGNVRELEHVVEQAVVTTPGPVVELEDLPSQIVATREEPFNLDFDHDRPLQDVTGEFVSRIERAYLIRVLERFRGRVDRCAAHCGLSRRSISEKLRRYQIDKSEFKPPPSRTRRRGAPSSRPRAAPANASVLD